MKRKNYWNKINEFTLFLKLKMILIENIENFLNRNVVISRDFSYYEREFILVFLLLKTKEKQPRTITINAGLVVPVNSPQIQGTAFG